MTSGSETWHSCLSYGKIVKKSIRALSRKLRVKFQGVKMQQKQNCFKCYCKLCPQDLTKWHSGLKWIFLKWNSQRNRSVWLSETLAWISTGVGHYFAFYQKLPLKFLDWVGNKNHSMNFGVLTGMWVFQNITLLRATNSAESQAKIRLPFHFVERKKEYEFSNWSLFIRMQCI